MQWTRCSGGQGGTGWLRREARRWRRGQPLVQRTAPSLKGPQLLAKRALDLLGATVGLIVVSPILAMLALLIKLDSRGPVFFRQERVGRGGRLFKILKLRTMVDGA